MGDMGDIFNDLREATRQRRASNTTNSAAMLQAAGVVFHSNNGGAHLIVQAGAHTIDFWPSTGLWMVRKQKARHGGVRKLIQFVQQQTKDTPT